MVTALQLELEPSANNYVTTVTVEVSSDLSRWRTLEQSAALARLSYAGQRIEQDRVALAPMRGPFLRVRAGSGRLPGTLSAVRAELVGSELAPRRERVRVEGTKDSQAEGQASDGQVFGFDLGGALPLERISIERRRE